MPRQSALWLTTLANRHVRRHGNASSLSLRGKSESIGDHAPTDPQARAASVRKLQELPGQISSSSARQGVLHQVRLTSEPLPTDAMGAGFTPRTSHLAARVLRRRDGGPLRQCENQREPRRVDRAVRPLQPGLATHLRSAPVYINPRSWTTTSTTSSRGSRAAIVIASGLPTELSGARKGMALSERRRQARTEG